MEEVYDGRLLRPCVTTVVFTYNRKQSLIQSDWINNAVNAMAFMVMTAAVKMIQLGGRGMYSSLV
jgi:hypothetical protein